MKQQKKWRPCLSIWRKTTRVALVCEALEGHRANLAEIFPPGKIMEAGRPAITLCPPYFCCCCWDGQTIRGRTEWNDPTWKQQSGEYLNNLQLQIEAGSLLRENRESINHSSLKRPLCLKFLTQGSCMGEGYKSFGLVQDLLRALQKCFLFKVFAESVYTRKYLG